MTVKRDRISRREVDFSNLELTDCPPQDLDEKYTEKKSVSAKCTDVYIAFYYSAQKEDDRNKEPVCSF